MYLPTGMAARRIANQMQDVSMEMICLPLLFYVQMACFKYVHIHSSQSLAYLFQMSNRIHTYLPRRIEQCRETLKELSEMASKADDLRAKALSDCCHYDALLDIGKFHSAIDVITVYMLLCY